MAGVFYKGLNRFGSMGAQSIPDQDHRPIQLTQKMPEEFENQFVIDIDVGMKTKIEMDAVALRGHAQGDDGGNLFVGTSFLIQQRCVAT